MGIDKDKLGQEADGLARKATSAREDMILYPTAAPASAGLLKGLHEVQARVGCMCERRLAERALLLDSEALHMQAMARIADRNARSRQVAEDVGRSEQLIRADIDLALRDLLILQEQTEEQELHQGLPWNALHRELMFRLGVKEELAVGACRRFNRLGENTRLVFFAMVLRGETVQECTARGWGSEATIGDHLRAGFDALLELWDEPAPLREKTEAK